MTKKKIVIAVVSVLLLIAMTVTALVSCSGGGTPDVTEPGNSVVHKPTPEPPADDEAIRISGEIDLETVEECQEVMVRYLGEATVTSTGSIIKHVEAVVHPDDAPNKAVEWSIAWAEGATRASEPVENYVKVYTATAGSTYATVECVQAFPGDEAIITVTTRKGGFKAYVSCTFVGYPDNFSFERNGHGKSTNDTAWNKTIIEYDCGSVYNVDFVPTNGVGVVGEEFSDWQIEFVHVYGGVNLKHTSKNAAGEVTSTGVEELMPTLKQTGSKWYVNFEDCGAIAHVFDAEIVDGRLQLTFEYSPTALHTYGASPAGSATQEFESFIDDKPMYYDIVIKEAKSGLTKTINVRGITTTTGVSIKDDATSVVF